MCVCLYVYIVYTYTYILSFSFHTQTDYGGCHKSDIVEAAVMVRRLQSDLFQSWSCNCVCVKFLCSYPWVQPQRTLVAVLGEWWGPSSTRGCPWSIRLRSALGFVPEVSECSVSAWAWQGKLQLIANSLQKWTFSRAKPICKIKLNLGSHSGFPSSPLEMRDVFLEVPTQLDSDAS